MKSKSGNVMFGSSPVIGGIRVDLAGILRLRHRCEPLKCRHRKSCCQSYEVFLGRSEPRRITGLVPHAARYAGHLVQNGTPEDPFEETEGGTCLATDESGRCVFAYTGAAGETLCSLHSAAEDLDLPPAKMKPLACALWPLYLIEGTPPILTVQPDALEFACNKSSVEETLDPGVLGIVTAVFGERFAGDLLAAATKRAGGKRQ